MLATIDTGHVIETNKMRNTGVKNIIFSLTHSFKSNEFMAVAKEREIHENYRHFTDHKVK